jgi:hypothetical protein
VDWFALEDVESIRQTSEVIWLGMCALAGRMPALPKMEHGSGSRGGSGYELLLRIKITD